MRENRFSLDKNSPYHYATAQSLHHLSAYYLEVGEFAQALTLLLRTKELFEIVYGNSHAEMAGIITTLGRAYHRLGNLDQALKLFLDAIHIRQQKIGEHHPRTAIAQTYLGDLQIDMRQFRDAADNLARALLTMKKEKFPNPRFLALNLHAQGRLNVATDHIHQAHHFFIEALTLRRQYLGDEHPHTRDSLETLERLMANERANIPAG